MNLQDTEKQEEKYLENKYLKICGLLGGTSRPQCTKKQKGKQIKKEKM
jgi:hypothetical protein